MHVASPALLRLVAFGVALALYSWVVGSTSIGDDALGAGLLAFLLLAVAAFAWAVVDGRRRGTATAVLLWAVVAGLLAVGWLVLGSVAGADDSMSATELMTADAGLVPFTFFLLLVPAAVGAAIGGATRRAAA